MKEKFTIAEKIGIFLITKMKFDGDSFVKCKHNDRILMLMNTLCTKVSPKSLLIKCFAEYGMIPELDKYLSLSK